MPWVKLDDGFWANPKVLAVGNEAAGAFARILSYCGQQLTDGHVDDQTAKYIAKASVYRKLEAHGFIERNGQGWQIPDYLEFNPSREKVEKERAAARKRMANVRGNGR